MWDQLVDFVTSRINRRTGVAYKNDPAIFAYTVLGEVIPYPRSMQANITALLRRVSTRLQQRDPNHLIGSGGLLHMSSYSGYFDPREYWKDLYGFQHVDFCMIHVYQTPDKVLPTTSGGSFQWSEWDNLAKYASFCQTLGKPFIVDEFGLKLDSWTRSTATRYFDYVFKKMRQNGPPIPIVEFWNWGLGPSFDIFISEDATLMELIRSNAVKWGFPVAQLGQVGPLDIGAGYLGTKVIDFDDSTDIQRIVSATTISSNVLSVSRTTSFKEQGLSSLKMSWSFLTESHETAPVTIPSTALETVNFNSASALVCSVKIHSGFPVQPVGHALRFQIQTKSGRVLVQNAAAVFTNFLVLYQWNRVIVRLDSWRDFAVSSSTFTTSSWYDELSSVRRVVIELIHQPGLKPMTGDLYVDNCRLIGDGKSMQTYEDFVTTSSSLLLKNCPAASSLDMNAGLISSTDGSIDMAKCCETADTEQIIPGNPTSGTGEVDNQQVGQPDDNQRDASSAENALFDASIILLMVGFVLFLAGLILILWPQCGLMARLQRRRGLTSTKSLLGKHTDSRSLDSVNS